MPYLKGFSEKLRRIGNQYQIRTVFKSAKTLRTILTKTEPDINQVWQIMYGRNITEENETVPTSFTKLSPGKKQNSRMLCA